MNSIILSLLLFIPFVLLGCSSVKNTENVKLKLRILHTNDHHGHYLQDKYGQAGMAARKTLIDQLRKENHSKNGASLLLSGGDINTGTMESDIFDAEPDFLGMKKLGYDAMAVGNHEFDNSYHVLKNQQKIASFPFLAANIFWKDSNRKVFNPYIIRTIEGVKIGILGLTTIDTPFKASHDDAKKKFDFRSIIESAKKTVKELREIEKVDIVIAVTHVGHHGSTTSNGDIDLAKKVDGIDVIVGGHSQEIINAEEHNNTIIVQAKDWGHYVGVLDLYIDKDNNKTAFDYHLKPVNVKKKVDGKRVFIEKEIIRDESLIKLFSSYKEKADRIGLRIVGSIDATLSGERMKVRSQQMPIAQFIGDSIRHQVKGIDAAVLNGGSIRATLSEGNVSRKDLHNVHPYGNTIATVKLSANEFFNYVESISKYAIVDSKNLIGGYPQLVNMKLTLKNNVLVKIEAADGTWLIGKTEGEIKSSKKTFVLGTMNFLAKGGDNYPKVSNHPNYNDSGFMLNAAMMNFIDAKKKIDTLKYSKLTKDIILFK